MVTAVERFEGKYGLSLLLTIEFAYKVYLTGYWVKRFIDLFDDYAYFYFKYFGMKTMENGYKFHIIRFTQK